MDLLLAVVGSCRLPLSTTACSCHVNVSVERQQQQRHHAPQPPILILTLASSSSTTSNANDTRILIRRRTTVTIVIVVMSASQLPIVVGRAPGGFVFDPPSPPPSPSYDCVRTNIDTGANPATLALGTLLPWRRADTVQPVPPPFFTPPSLVVTPLALCGCLFCPPHQQAMQQPAGSCRTPPPSPLTAIDLISLRFGACGSLVVADCCLLPPPAIGARCHKGLRVKAVALSMTPWL